MARTDRNTHTPGHCTPPQWWVPVVTHPYRVTQLHSHCAVTIAGGQFFYRWRHNRPTSWIIGSSDGINCGFTSMKQQESHKWSVNRIHGVGQKYWVGIVQWAPETSVSEEIADVFRNYNMITFPWCNHGNYLHGCLFLDKVQLFKWITYTA